MSPSVASEATRNNAAAGAQRPTARRRRGSPRPRARRAPFARRRSTPPTRARERGAPTPAAVGPRAPHAPRNHGFRNDGIHATNGGVRVLVHMGDSFAAQIADACPGVESIPIPTADPIDPSLRADAVLTLPWGTPNLADVVRTSGARWVHTVGTGVDRFPLDAIGDRLLTCSRGASAIPISEWVLAQMLAFEKEL